MFSSNVFSNVNLGTIFKINVIHTEFSNAINESTNRSISNVSNI